MGKQAATPPRRRLAARLLRPASCLWPSASPWPTSPLDIFLPPAASQSATQPVRELSRESNSQVTQATRAACAPPEGCRRASPRKPGNQAASQAIDDDSNQTGSMLAGMLDWPQARRRANIRRASRAPECPLNFRLPTGLRTCSKLAALKGLREALRSLRGVRSLPQIYLGDKDLSPQRAFQRAISGGLFDLSESSEVSS